MIICIPTTDDNGLASQVSAHFGSAPVFMLVDTETDNCRALPNRNTHHGHGMCQPLMALAGEKIDGMVVGGIGRGALGKLLAAGINVYMAEQPTVDETLRAFKSGTLRAVTPGMACGHRGHGNERGRARCGHGHATE